MKICFSVGLVFLSLTFFDVVEARETDTGLDRLTTIYKALIAPEFPFFTEKTARAMAVSTENLIDGSDFDREEFATDVVSEIRVPTEVNLKVQSEAQMQRLLLSFATRADVKDQIEAKGKELLSAVSVQREYGPSFEEIHQVSEEMHNKLAALALRFNKKFKHAGRLLTVEESQLRVVQFLNHVLFGGERPGSALHLVFPKGMQTADYSKNAFDILIDVFGKENRRTIMKLMYEQKVPAQELADMIRTKYLRCAPYLASR